MIFKSFPEEPNLYVDDIQDMVSKTIECYGMKEWRAGILTNELHGHLGIYSIIGVKMGIFALEKLDAETGDISIISYAGVKPPISCMNDGLQVSTGATLGHGLIESKPTDNPRTEAIFRSKEKQLILKINNLTSCMITEEITEAVNRWGHSDKYWKYVRELAIQYWYKLDRNNIFEIELSNIK